MLPSVHNKTLNGDRLTPKIHMALLTTYTCIPRINKYIQSIHDKYTLKNIQI